MDLYARLTAVIRVVIETFHKCSMTPMLTKMHWLTPKRHRPLHDQKYPKYVLLVKCVTWESVTCTVSPNPKFLFVSLCRQHFSSLRPFWHNRSKLPKDDHEHPKAYPIWSTSTRRVPNFNPRHSTTNHFRVTGQIVTSAPSDHKLTER